jgi:two-component system cell cycle sensor histidine kinase/response regulator CckA
MELLTGYAVPGVLLGILLAVLLVSRRRAKRTGLRTAGLHALNASLEPALSPHDVAVIVIRHAVQALDARCGTIALSGPDGQVTTIVHSPDRPGEGDDPDGPLAHALRSGSALFVESGAERRSRFPGATVRGEARGSAVAVPFVVQGRPSGGIELEFEDDRRFGPEDRNFIMVLAGQGAQALERARLYEAERAARQHAEGVREHLAFLAEASQVLASSLDYRATLSAVARLAVPRLADWCAVDIVDSTGRHRRLAISHADPAKVDAVWAMSHRYAEVPDDPVPRVIASGEPRLIPEIPDDLLRHFARDERHLEALRAFGLRSLLIVPLVARGRTLGAITFVMAESGRRYEAGDLLLGQDLARRSAMAVDNARLYGETELALQAKERSLALLDLVFRGAPIGLAFVDRDLRYVRVNEALARINGVAVEAHLGRTIAEVLGPAAALVTPLFEEVFRSGQPVLEREIPMPVDSEGTERVLVASCYPVQAPEGQMEWVGCIVSDVTEPRRSAALQVQSERMEAIARVAGGVAHEVNNMMTVIAGFSEFLARSLPPADPRMTDVAEIRRAADRAAGITRQLLAYSRQQLLQPTALDLDALVRRMAPVLARLVGPAVTLELHPAGVPAPVRADPAQLEQVLINLALNARDAMPEGGTLALVAETVSVGPEETRLPGVERMPPGRYVRLALRDTGHGMDAATRARVFEPFFTTKPAGQGSGLGLATVYGIVKQSGGFIWVASEPGQGTTFRIYLPEDIAATAEPDVAAVEPASPRGSETILVVDDEAAVRRMTTRALSAQGYATLEAENGAHALELLGGSARQVDLVLTDVVMPGLNGRELGELLAVERPGLPVLFMSGYTDDDVIRRGLLRPGSPFIQKPFLPAALARKVREELDSRCSS